MQLALLQCRIHHQESRGCLIPGTFEKAKSIKVKLWEMSRPDPVTLGGVEGET